MNHLAESKWHYLYNIDYSITTGEQTISAHHVLIVLSIHESHYKTHNKNRLLLHKEEVWPTDIKHSKYTSKQKIWQQSYYTYACFYYPLNLQSDSSDDLMSCTTFIRFKKTHWKLCFEGRVRVQTVSFGNLKRFGQCNFISKGQR